MTDTNERNDAIRALARKLKKHISKHDDSYDVLTALALVLHDSTEDTGDLLWHYGMLGERLSFVQSLKDQGLEF